MYKLIVVDDEAIIRRGLHRVIPWNELGFEVVALAEDGIHALKKVEKYKPDVLLTDISMPEMSGLELIENAKRICPNLRTVIISGYDAFEYAVAAIKYKVEDYILKPLDPDAISRTFRRIREDLDRDTEQWMAGRHGIQVKTEYALMRQLNSDMTDNRYLRELSETNRYLRIAIIRCVARSETQSRTNDQSEPAFSQNGESFSFLNEYYCVSTDELYAWVFPESQLQTFVRGFEEFRMKDEAFASYICAISRSFHSISEILDAYLSTTPLLYGENPLPVAFSDDSTGLPNRKESMVLRKELIDSMENGSLTESFLDHFIVEMKRNGRQLKDSFESVLREVVRYFQIWTDWIPEVSQVKERQTEDQCSDFFTRLERAFRDDIFYIDRILRERSDTMASTLVKRAKQEIGTSYADRNFSLKSLAERLNVSYGYLSTIFSKHAGETFSSCLRDYRLEKARELLVGGEYKIYEIAEKTGYSDAKHFSEMFKKKYSVSPNEYVVRMKGSIYAKEN